MSSLQKTREILSSQFSEGKMKFSFFRFIVFFLRWNSVINTNGSGYQFLLFQLPQHIRDKFTAKKHNTFENIKFQNEHTDRVVSKMVNYSKSST